MDDKQKQEQRLAKLEKAVQLLERRVIELQLENKRLKSRTIRLDQSATSLAQQIQQLQRGKR